MHIKRHHGPQVSRLAKNWSQKNDHSFIRFTENPASEYLHSFHILVLITIFPLFYISVSSKASCLTDMSYNLFSSTKPNSIPPNRGADRVKRIKDVTLSNYIPLKFDTGIVKFSVLDFRTIYVCRVTVRWAAEDKQHEISSEVFTASQPECINWFITIFLVFDQKQKCSNDDV